MVRTASFGGPPLHFFAKGDFKGLVLHMLEEKPMHGYEIMKALEERSKGFYTPSPGSIYPALRALSRRGFVSAAGRNGRTTYKITAAGRAFLRERRKEIQARMRAFESAVGPERAAALREIRATGKLVGANMRVMTPAQAKRIQAVLRKAQREIVKILG